MLGRRVGAFLNGKRSDSPVRRRPRPCSTLPAPIPDTAAWPTQSLTFPASTSRVWTAHLRACVSTSRPIPGRCSALSAGSRPWRMAANNVSSTTPESSGSPSSSCGPGAPGGADNTPALRSLGGRRRSWLRLASTSRPEPSRGPLTSSSPETLSSPPWPGTSRWGGAPCGKPSRGPWSSA